MQETNRVSLATARSMPVILGLIIIYVCYVVIHPLTINYFLNPPRDDIAKRMALGIAIPVVHFVLLIPVIVCYGRLLQVVLLDPGYVELGIEPRLGVNEPQPGLEEFYNRDAFVCDENGLPLRCGFCHNWKHDRGHHNQDTGRCCWKMDHFCPWVGGVVGERCVDDGLMCCCGTRSHTSTGRTNFSSNSCSIPWYSQHTLPLFSAGWWLATRGAYSSSLSSVWQASSVYLPQEWCSTA